jgi:AcrR family transcriptional regulator
MAADRRRQVLDAFIELIAVGGLESVTLDDVAGLAGVQRSAIRHYIGNRPDLVEAATERLTERYVDAFRSAVGADPSSREIVKFLFAGEWSTAMGEEDRALGVLFQEAARNTNTRHLLKLAYQALLDEVAGAIRRDQPCTDEKAAAVAYQIICLAEHNIDMQFLGFASEYAVQAQNLAHSLISQSA